MYAAALAYGLPVALVATWWWKDGPEKRQKAGHRQYLFLLATFWLAAAVSTFLAVLGRLLTFEEAFHTIILPLGVGGLAMFVIATGSFEMFNPVGKIERAAWIYFIPTSVMIVIALLVCADFFTGNHFLLARTFFWMISLPPAWMEGLPITRNAIAMSFFAYIGFCMIGSFLFIVRKVLSGPIAGYMAAACGVVNALQLCLYALLIFDTFFGSLAPQAHQLAAFYGLTL